MPKIDITDEFADLPVGSLLYSPMFESRIGEMYNCKLLKVVAGEKVVVSHNGIKYTFDKIGQFGDIKGLNLFLHKPKNKRNYED